MDVFKGFQKASKISPNLRRFGLMGMNGEKSDVDVGVIGVGFGVLLFLLELLLGDKLTGLFDDVACNAVLVEDDILVGLPVHIIVLGEHEEEGADIEGAVLAVAFKKHEVVPWLGVGGQHIGDEDPAFLVDKA